MPIVVTHKHGEGGFCIDEITDDGGVMPRIIDHPNGGHYSNDENRSLRRDGIYQWTSDGKGRFVPDNIAEQRTGELTSIDPDKIKDRETVEDRCRKGDLD